VRKVESAHHGARFSGCSAPDAAQHNSNKKKQLCADLALAATP
jgi:hypothetical protein